jgi:hypothetical protein
MPRVRNGLARSDRSPLEVERGQRNCTQIDPVSKPASQVKLPPRKHCEKSAVNLTGRKSIDGLDKIFVTRSGDGSREKVFRNRLSLGPIPRWNSLDHLKTKKPDLLI